MQTLKGQNQTLKADALVDWQPTQGFEMVGNRIKPPRSDNQSGSSVLDSLQSQDLFLWKTSKQRVVVVQSGKNHSFNQGFRRMW